MADRPIRALRVKLERGHVWGCTNHACDVIVYTVTPTGDCPRCKQSGVPVELGLTLRNRERIAVPYVDEDEQRAESEFREWYGE